MLLIRNPVSATKKFFQKTVESFKSLISGTGGGEGSYQRLPKTPPLTPFSCSTNTRDMEALPESSAKKSAEKKKAAAKEMGSEERLNTPRRERRRTEEKREERIWMVAKRLKEMEMMERGNVDNRLDIEEFFKCYCRLSCSTYIDIVDGIFMELYAEFFADHDNYKVHLPLMRF